MTPAQIDLARRLAALPGFAMTPGMRDPDGIRVLRMVAARTYYADGVSEGADPEVPFDGWHEYTHNGATNDPEVIPDLTDDATGGVLLGWLWALDPAQHVHRDGPRVIVHVAPGIAEYVGSTLAEACARALVGMGRCA